MESNDTLKEFISKKSEVLKKYFQGQITVTWTLTPEKVQRIAHCHLVGNHMDYFGEGSTEDYKASVDLALDKIEIQVKKHKEKITSHS
jgi:putative sigma-54 modulation protein